jgi:hypothetical protein
MEPQTIKISWDQWQEQRSALRAISRKIAPDGLCRAVSSSDARLKRLFEGKRRPQLGKILTKEDE